MSQTSSIIDPNAEAMTARIRQNSRLLERIVALALDKLPHVTPESALMWTDLDADGLVLTIHNCRIRQTY